MFINSINIEKYKVLENIKIEFATQKSSKLENGNIANVIAGVNGCGKTSLLEWIFGIFNSSINSINIEGSLVINDSENISKNNVVNYFSSLISSFRRKVTDENKYINGTHSSPRLIYIPSNMIFNYRAVTELNYDYSFTNKIDSQKIVGNAELFIKEFIIIKIMDNNEDRSNLEIKKDAINSFNSIFQDCDFITKLVDLDKFNNNKPVFETINGDRVFIDKLSSGEQQLYARVVSLMILNPQNSIILIDEPEIALHPKWQIDIMKIYLNIGKNNQFIVTTHSPFIISQTHYKNLTFLVKESEKIVAKQFKDAPHRDINTLVKTVMGAEYMPIELQKLQDEYRELFEKEEEESKRGLELKREILEWESSNSSFWQSIDFDKELRDFK
jgi:predicted ATP-dependent endonuclease of OLD family